MKLYENHTIVTQSWRTTMPKILRGLAVVPAVVFIMALVFFALLVIMAGGLVWFITLGHLHLYRLGLWISKNFNDSSLKAFGFIPIGKLIVFLPD